MLPSALAQHHQTRKTCVKLLIYRPSFTRIEASLKKVAPDIEAIFVLPDGALEANGKPMTAENIEPEIAWPNTEVYIGGPAREFLTAILKSPTVKWVQTSSAGVDGGVFASMLDNGITLTNSNASAIAISEFVLASVLEAFQPNQERREAQAAGIWRHFTYNEINDTNWLIVGYGNIGQEIAARAQAFGARIKGVARSTRTVNGIEVVARENMLEAVTEADVVVLSASYTAATENIVDDAFLKVMKSHSILVNIGRGGLVDEDALLSALDRGVPERAILDVFKTEPLPRESRFWTHPRVRLTGHSAADSHGFERRNDELFLENLRRYRNGEPLKFIVSEDQVRRPPE
jgi:phosphoglycerate dehydrogenase-like enzyme